MKNIFKLIFTIFILSGCIKYTQPKLLSLSGTYVIDKVVYDNDGNISEYNISNTGSNVPLIFPSNTGKEPFDTIFINGTKCSFDYQLFFYNQDPTVVQGSSWTKQCDYDVKNQTVNYLGDLILYLENYSKPMRFRIIEDGLEYLILRQESSWPYGSSGPEVSLTYHLTRTGP